MTFKALLKGWVGEQKTRLVQKLLLDGEEYHTFNNVIVQSNSRPAQIDHIIVSKYGVFVVETKNKDGWIYGSTNEEEWTETFYKKKYRFQNPLRQNYAHTRSLAEFLGIDHGKIQSVIVFWGKCQFKTQMQPNVVKSTGIISYIKSKKQILFTDNEVNNMYNNLVMLQYETPVFSGLRHASALKKRYESNTTCPKCGGSLIKRKARTGKRTGQEFLGCENYPQCRYIKGL